MGQSAVVNRREFFKGLAGSAALAPFLPLLPSPARAIEPVFVLPGARVEGWLVLESVTLEPNFENSLEPFFTGLNYRGSRDRVACLFTRLPFRRYLRSLLVQDRTETIEDEWGGVGAIITFDEQELSVVLKGLWCFEPGPIWEGNGLLAGARLRGAP